MNSRKSIHFGKAFHTATALWCLILVSPSFQTILGQEVQNQFNSESSAGANTSQEAPLIPDGQLDSLVAPIALFPDPLLSQTLVASTYPLELIQLQQWMDRNKGLKGQSLADAVQQQPWDPSIQSMVAFPDVVKRLAGNIQWTTDLGNAFLGQQADVMRAVQRMRAKAQASGSLQSGPQQVVQTQTVGGGQQVIVIEPANSGVVYVPSYDPMAVYGTPPSYPYPPFSYPGYLVGSALTFGAGIALGATWGGCWGYSCGWGKGNVNINYNNNYNRNSYNNLGNISRNTYNNINVSSVNRGNANTTNIKRGNVSTGNQITSGSWQHNPQHRGGAPYGNQGTNRKFLGNTSGHRPSLGQNHPTGGSGFGSGAGLNRPTGGAGLGTGAGVTRPSTLPANRPSGGNAIGHRNISSSSGGGAFAESARSGASARASSDRGSRSFASGGGRPVGGGGHAGGRR